MDEETSKRSEKLSRQNGSEAPDMDKDQNEEANGFPSDVDFRKFLGCGG